MVRCDIGSCLPEAPRQSPEYVACTIAPYCSPCSICTHEVLHARLRQTNFLLCPQRVTKIPGDGCTLLVCRWVFFKLPATADLMNVVMTSFMTLSFCHRRYICLCIYLICLSTCYSSYLASWLAACLSVCLFVYLALFSYVCIFIHKWLGK